MLQSVNSGISQVLYEVSSALFLPVMLTVLLLFFIVLLILGGLFREALDRGRVRAALRQALELLTRGAPQAIAAWHALEQSPSGLPCRITREATPLPDRARLTRRLADLETEVALQLGRLAFLARVGPMLGLLGTLIPFGPALAGLSSGDVQELSANLVTAFATTVVGLLCGALAFGISLVRRGWYARDFDDLEHLARLLAECPADEAAEDPEMGRDGRRSDGRLGQLI